MPTRHRFDWVLWLMVVAFSIVSTMWLTDYYHNIKRQVELAHAAAEQESRFKEAHRELETLAIQMRMGPRNTACDARELISVLRSNGLEIPHMDVESRCQSPSNSP